MDRTNSAEDQRPNIRPFPFYGTGAVRHGGQVRAASGHIHSTPPAMIPTATHERGDFL